MIQQPLPSSNSFPIAAKLAVGLDHPVTGDDDGQLIGATCTDNCPCSSGAAESIS